MLIFKYINLCLQCMLIFNYICVYNACLFIVFYVRIFNCPYPSIKLKNYIHPHPTPPPKKKLLRINSEKTIVVYYINKLSDLTKPFLIVSSDSVFRRALIHTSCKSMMVISDDIVLYILNLLFYKVM